MSWEDKFKKLKPGQMLQATKPFYETGPIRVFKAKTPIMVIDIDFINGNVFYLVEDIKSSMDAYNFFICFEEMKQ